MTDRYSEMEMTKIARAEFNRGKTTRTQEILDIIYKFKINGDKYILCGSKSSPVLLDGRLKEDLKQRIKALDNQQKQKDIGTLSNSVSGDTKQGGTKTQDDEKLQIERSASLPVDNHSADCIPYGYAYPELDRIKTKKVKK